MSDIMFEGREAGTLTDLSEYEGKKFKIAGMEIIVVPTSFDEQGKPTTTPRQVPRLRVYSEPITQIKDRDGNDRDVVASELFAVDEDSTADKVTYSKSDRAALMKFMQLQKVDSPENLVGTQVTVLMRGEFLGYKKE